MSSVSFCLWFFKVLGSVSLINQDTFCNRQRPKTGHSIEMTEMVEFSTIASPKSASTTEASDNHETAFEDNIYCIKDKKEENPIRKISSLEENEIKRREELDRIIKKFLEDAAKRKYKNQKDEQARQSVLNSSINRYLHSEKKRFCFILNDKKNITKSGNK
ncbi:hypothetical protein EDEG_03070 [Edhazardia aedis USNM 41457]|uniref:Uncharacterized protein n=1 Tax=Edhazardia aedis (strain USNM 41457) TaxID=1003232 RepID=J9D3X7_EDHAE|nr:hypothetical protein EDEG_03070 [Edhazardia aedis USNM 41457]|eukprot:EJW02516.1 hypothetical protein EDEG_03070 [Edhazardia aedis USNM 41457]